MNPDAPGASNARYAENQSPPWAPPRPPRRAQLHSGDPLDFLSSLNAPLWMAEATCAQTDPESFFPEPGGSTSGREAKLICSRCPVRIECLDHALTHDERFGIFGGLSEMERRPLRRARKAGAL